MSPETMLSDLAEARERTLAIIAPFEDHDMERVTHPIMSPLVWDLAHIAAYEDLWLAHPPHRPLRGPGAAPPPRRAAAAASGAGRHVRRVRVPSRRPRRPAAARSRAGGAAPRRRAMPLRGGPRRARARQRDDHRSGAPLRAPTRRDDASGDRA